MNPEIKKRWCEALRSGKYPQTKGELRNDGGYCCLGVLCDVIDGSKWYLSDDGYHYENECNLLPDLIIMQAGLDLGNPLVDRGDGVTGLAETNDDGLTFAEIADLIEAQL